jgi:dihydroorotate dehydrogenase electron transfer subunit
MPCFADRADTLTTELLLNEVIARDTYRLRFAAPQLAELAVPGQFFMIRLSGFNDPLIGRALAMYDRGCDAAGKPATIDLVYVVKGRLTSRLAELGPGSKIDVWGPLGNGFAPQEVDDLILVAGGIGQTPFLAVAQEALGLQSFGSPARCSGYARRRVTLCYGARTAGYFAGLEAFRATGMDVRLATDDGSLGPPRRVTDLLEEILVEPASGSRRILCCGPEPMMEATAKLAQRYNVPCLVSLETPMACGIGICFTCVARVGSEDDWDYKRTCVEGPIFDADQIVW